MTNAEALVPAGRFNLGLAYADDRNGFAHGVEDLKLVAGFLAGSPPIPLHDGGEITLAKSVIRKILSQDNVAEKFVSHRGAG